MTDEIAQALIAALDALREELARQRIIPQRSWINDVKPPYTTSGGTTGSPAPHLPLRMISHPI